MIVSFTGTRDAASSRQLDQLALVLTAFYVPQKYVYGIGSPIGPVAANEFHFGGAVGADRQARRIAKDLGFAIHWHPCPGVARTEIFGDDPSVEDEIWHEVFPPLVRNKHLVAVGGVLIAAPFTDNEELRSGTWATIRYARAALKPVVMLSRGVAS